MSLTKRWGGSGWQARLAAGGSCLMLMAVALSAQGSNPSGQQTKQAQHATQIGIRGCVVAASDGLRLREEDTGVVYVLQGDVGVLEKLQGRLAEVKGTFTAPAGKSIHRENSYVLRVQAAHAIGACPLSK